MPRPAQYLAAVVIQTCSVVRLPLASPIPPRLQSSAVEEQRALANRNQPPTSGLEAILGEDSGLLASVNALNFTI